MCFVPMSCRPNSLSPREPLSFAARLGRLSGGKGAVAYAHNAVLTGIGRRYVPTHYGTAGLTARITAHYGSLASALVNLVLPFGSGDDSGFGY